MSKTTLVTQQVQLQEWFHMMQESKGRPQQIPLDEWCKENYGISAAGYYYRVRKVKEAYLDQVSEEKLQENLAIVPKELFHEDHGVQKIYQNFKPQILSLISFRMIFAFVSMKIRTNNFFSVC